MAPEFRALISVPIAAEDDESAMEVGTEYAHSLSQPGGGKVAAGHLELLGETRDDAMEIVRVVHADPAFLHQLPPDWKL
jgi:hypothetical protein